MSAPDALAAGLLAAVRHSFQQYQALADKALAQLTPEQWLWRPGPEANSAAVLVQHLVGNLRSRFTDFWTSDGEKPDRHRDQEFEEPTSPAAVAELQQQWQQAWPVLWAVLEHLEQHPADWLRTVYIRQEPYTALGALQRQATHYAYHTGQLVQLAKQIRGEAWQTLSIPRGQSEQFNAAMRRQANPGLNLRGQSAV
ncbi:DUF1572 domain-containing protein [Hymenobacter latericus]|uniref:DUF1572 domain-containing protein n=1 Tax=Hymenobacter sp. YIM 151858-1 TaxID=2987688 RepID=UPI00222600B7|nr:DUF1572 domain-containing protein [Hymenobacter sp. YIM 151858-1]UYZ59536.1 DUF1572 domain-containing protein [Hymenobacter sp. YIM 151858-1]